MTPNMKSVKQALTPAFLKQKPERVEINSSKKSLFPAQPH
jgi:hypothetical protein